MFNKKERQPDIQLFSIHDSKTDSYNEPCFAINEHDLARQISNMFQEQRQKNKFYANSEDYSMFKIADYCYKTGTILAHVPKHVFNMRDIRTAVEHSDPPVDSIGQ